MASCSLCGNRTDGGKGGGNYVESLEAQIAQLSLKLSLAGSCHLSIGYAKVCRLTYFSG